MHRRRARLLRFKELQWSVDGFQWRNSVGRINILELEVMKPAVISLTKFKKLNSIHLWIDDMTALF